MVNQESISLSAVVQEEIEDTKGVVMRGRKSKKYRQCKAQKFEDTKGVIRSRESMKYRQCKVQKFEDTKGVIRSRESMKYRQYNGQSKEQEDKQQST